MTLPAFKAAGTGSAVATAGNSTSPAWPTHATGDFGLLCVETDSGTYASPSGSVATPSGWTLIALVVGLNGGHTKLYVYYRFATSSSETAPTITVPTSGDHIFGVIVTYTGVNTSTPVHGLSTQAMNAGTAQWLPGLTTILDDCMIVSIASYNNDSAGPLFSAETNGNLGSLSERHDAGTTLGNGGGIYVVDGTLATKGASGPTGVTMGTGGALAALTIALQAADKQETRLGQKTRMVNTGM